MTDNTLPESDITVLAYWQSLGNYNVKGVVCAVYKDGEWYERIEFADDETGKPQFVAINPSCYMIYSWRLVPEPLTQGQGE